MHDKNSVLTTQEVKAAVIDTLHYLQEIVNDDNGWLCKISTEELMGQVSIVTVSANAQKAIVRITPAACDGFMLSPLTHASQGEWAPLFSFADLLDFLIVHLCPAMCVPRAIYYIIHTMRMCMLPSAVDAQIAIEEKAGVFTLHNPREKKACEFSLKVVDGEPVLFYGKGKTMRAPQRAQLAPDTDFVQHAFYKQPNVRYVQHPDVDKGLKKLLKKVGLAGMDEAMKSETLELLNKINTPTPARSARSAMRAG